MIYLVHNSEACEAAIIDPVLGYEVASGSASNESGDQIVDYVAENIWCSLSISKPMPMRNTGRRAPIYRKIPAERSRSEAVSFVYLMGSE